MTKREMIRQIHELRHPGDPMIPFDKQQMEERLKQLKSREAEKKRQSREKE